MTDNERDATPQPTAPTDAEPAPGTWLVDVAKLDGAPLTASHPAVTTPYRHCAKCSKPGVAVKHPPGSPCVVHKEATTQPTTPPDAGLKELAEQLISKAVIKWNGDQDRWDALVLEFVEALTAFRAQAIADGGT